MELKSLINEYPVYVPDQFLSSENLNTSFNYLEEQERITRYGIVGQGIIKDLTYTTTKTLSNVTTISIASGHGSSADGYFLYVPETANNGQTIDYKSLKDVTIKIKLNNPGAAEKSVAAKQLLTAAQAASDEFKKDAVALKIDEAELKTKYVLVLYADLKDEQSANCLPGTCDINGKNRIVRTFPMLIERTQFAAINLILPEIAFIHLSSASSIAKASSSNDYKTKLNAVVINNLKLLQTKATEIKTNAASLLPTDATMASNGLKKLDDIIKNPEVNSNLNEYYISFCNDLQNAINEYINTYNNFIEKYYNTDNTNRYKRLLVLGQFPYAVTDVYRYWWTSPLSSRDRRATYFIMASQFRRVYSLMLGFLETTPLTTLLNSKYGTDPAKRIKITPDKGMAQQLGDRAIPYYYNTLDPSNEVMKNWRSQDLNNRPDLSFNYYDDQASARPTLKNPFAFNVMEYPFYRIEGYVGLDVSTAFTSLQSNIKNNNLAIRLIKINLDNETWGGIKEEYYNLIKDYKAFYTDLQKVDYGANQKEFLSYTKTFKSIYDTLNETSYRSVEEMRSIVNNVKSYSTMFLSGSTQKVAFRKMDNSDVEKAVSVEQPLYTGAVAERVKTVISNHNVTSWRDRFVKAIPNTTINSEYSLSELEGAEYLGGVYKGGTFILLYSGTKVIGELSLPYFIEKKVAK